MQVKVGGGASGTCSLEVAMKPVWASSGGNRSNLEAAKGVLQARDGNQAWKWLERWCGLGVA